jgi:N-acyl-D-aspartate/D-glutamate deacylase
MYTDLAEALANTKGVIWQLSDNDLMKAKLQLLRVVSEINREQDLRTMCVHQEEQRRVDLAKK